MPTFFIAFSEIAKLEEKMVGTAHPTKTASLEIRSDLTIHSVVLPQTTLRQLVFSS